MMFYVKIAAVNINNSTNRHVHLKQYMNHVFRMGVALRNNRLRGV